VSRPLRSSLSELRVWCECMQSLEGGGGSFRGQRDLVVVQQIGDSQEV
jgi:hypothetical protein